MNCEEVRKAIFNMGGATRAGIVLEVSTNTVHSWVRKGVIPNLDKARKVAEASGFDLRVLRPMYVQEAA